jgi:hypothetical protein
MKRIALIAFLLLAGCGAPMPIGVQMDDEEAMACKEAGCTVWTEAELRELMKKVWLIGYEAGRKSL